MSIILFPNFQCLLYLNIYRIPLLQRHAQIATNQYNTNFLGGKKKDLKGLSAIKVELSDHKLETVMFYSQEYYNMMERGIINSDKMLPYH